MCLSQNTPDDLAMNPETLKLLCQHELTKEEGRNWVIHLRGARNLIHYQMQQQERRLTPDSRDLKRQTKHPWEQVTLFAERCFAFFDVMGRTACGEEPVFGNDFWDSQDDVLDFWMGCSPRFVKIIGAVTDIHRMYQSHSESRESRLVLDRQRGQLQDLIQQPVIRGTESSGNEDWIMWHCAELKRLTADLYIHAALWNSAPAAPTTRRKVRDILCLISKLLDLGITAGLSWPLIMVACQLDPGEELVWAMGAERGGGKSLRFARPFILFALEELSGSLSSVARTRLVIEKVWRRREAALLEAHPSRGEETFNDWA